MVSGLAVVLATMAGHGCGDEDAPASLRGAVRNPPLEVASVSLPDAGDDGRLVAMQAPPSELYLIYFGYTSCPDVCPTTLSDIRVALEALPAELAARVTVGMATVDPERDTEEVLTGYLAHFFDRSLALRTTDPDALEDAAAAFGVQWESAEHDQGEAYDVSHTAITYVIDDQGTVVVEWPFGFEHQSMTADLTTLLREEDST